jgi:hypothetical protein
MNDFGDYFCEGEGFDDQEKIDAVKWWRRSVKGDMLFRWVGC